MTVQGSLISYSQKIFFLTSLSPQEDWTRGRESLPCLRDFPSITSLTWRNPHRFQKYEGFPGIIENIPPLRLGFEYGGQEKEGRSVRRGTSICSLICYSIGTRPSHLILIRFGSTLESKSPFFCDVHFGFLSPNSDRRSNTMYILESTSTL